VFPRRRQSLQQISQRLPFLAQRRLQNLRLALR
jgi:hypothetical protein